MPPEVTTGEYTRLPLVDDHGDPAVINLGCGTDDTGLGIDIHYDPDIHHDLNEGVPLDDAVADIVIANHILEHLNDPKHFLDEVHRVLKPDGELRLEVPNIGWLPVRVWVTQDQHRFWEHKASDKKGHWLARRLGRTEPERTPHRTLWTKALLADYLERAGFQFSITGSHISRNLSAIATPSDGSPPPGRTLHELERDHGRDLAANDYWAQTRSRVITNWIDRLDPDRVLDIGCGSGYLTAEIAAAEPERDVIGIDTNEDSIRVAQARDSAAAFEVADAFDLAYTASSFDCIVLGDVLEHFEDPSHLLEHAHRVLQPDGRVIVSVPAFRALMGPHDEHNDHKDRYTARRLDEASRPAGLRVERHQYTNIVPMLPYFVYQRVLRRPIPGSARGGHNRLVEAVKRACIRVESSVPWPIGITLIAQLEPLK